MKILRAKYPHDWKNEAFLGIICAFVYREEEAFVHIQNAYKQLEDPPQSLILAYISAGHGPDHFLTREKITELSKKVIEKGVTYESALHMAFSEQDLEKQKDWEEKASDAEKKGIHTPIITPNILKDVFKADRGYQYEE